MSEEFPLDNPVDNNKNHDSKYDLPPTDQPGIDPTSYPNEIKEQAEGFDPKDLTNKEFDTTIIEDFTNDNIKNDGPNPNDYVNPKGPNDGGSTPPPMSAAENALPPEMDPKTPPPIQQMPRQPFHEIEEK